MIAKAVTLFGLLAVAHAGAPAVTYLNQHVGVGGSNTVRGVAGLSSITHQAKAVDSAFSTVRKTDTRVTNDAVAVAGAPAFAYSQPGVAYAQQAPVAYAQQAPVAYAQQAPVAYAQQAPVAYAQQAPVAYAQQAPVAYAQHAPVAYAQQAPVAYAQPAVAHAQQAYGHPAAGVAYGHKTVSGAPVAAAAKVAAAAPAYASPVAYAQPAVAKYAAPVAYAQPAVAKVAAPVAYAQPAVAKYAAPLAKAAPAGLLGVAFSPVVPATASLHFNGFGTSYTLF